MKNKAVITNDLIDSLVDKVKESAKYRAISEELIRRIAAQELEKRSNLWEAVKATKNKLHQVGGAYLDRPIDYNLCITELKAAYLRGKEDFLQACQQVMCYHSSTRERLPVIERFYSPLLAEIHPIRSVLDLACGLNPLAMPWMDLPEDVEYFAMDIYSDMIDFINQYIILTRKRGRAVVGDVISYAPTQSVDVAFVLKTIPCLEQVDKSTGARLLNNLAAKHMIVSFPIHSLGGRRDKGMLDNYSNRFNEIVAGKDWSVKRYEYPSELVFLVSK